MGEAVIRRPFTAEARFRPRASSCEIRGERRGTGRRSLRTLALPCEYHPTKCSKLALVCTFLLPEAQTYEDREP
jgi:hypothetical protein